MLLWKKNLLLLWISQLLVMAGFAAMIPFIPLFIKNELKITDAADLADYVAYFNLFGSFAYAIFNPIWGKLGDRFGIKPMLLRGTLVTAFLFPLMGYVSNVWILILLRFLTAACAGTTSASQMMIARTTPETKQGFALGVLTTAYWGGMMLGNVLGGFLIHYFNYQTAFWTCGIMYMLAGVSVIFTRDNGIRRASASAGIRRTGHAWTPGFTVIVWSMLLLFFLLGVCRNCDSPFLALKVEEISTGDAAYWTGIVSSFVSIGAILSGFVFGMLTDKISPLKLLVPIFIISAVTIAIEGTASGVWLLTAARFCYFLVVGGLPPILQKTIACVTPTRKRGGAFGFASCAVSVGAMASALIGGWSMQFFGINGVFYVPAVMYLIFLPVFYHILNKATHTSLYRSYFAKKA